MSEVKFRDRGNRIYIPNNVTFVPKTWSASDKGGFRRARIEAFGDAQNLLELTEMLAYDTTVYNDVGSRVWNGYVDEVTIYLGNVSIGFKISGMANKIRVFYNEVGATGGSRSKYTNWITNSDSVSRYGIIERIVSLADVAEDAANAKATKLLDSISKPTKALSFEGQGNRAYARIECLGWYYTLDWRMYKEERGYEAHSATGSFNQPLGLGFTSNEVGFNDRDNSIHVIGNQLRAFEDGSQIRVTGSASNNALYTINEVSNRSYEEYQTESLFENDDIFDINELMNSKYDVYDLLKVSDTVDNNGYYFIFNVTSTKVEVEPSPLTYEWWDDTTLEAGSAATLGSSVTTEYPSATVTVRDLCQTAAREFTALASGSWRFKKIYVKLKKVGSPSDNVQVSLASDAGSQLYSIIESATVAGSNISESYDWVEFTFTGNNSITGGSDYAILVTRTGSVDPDNYYVLQMDENSPDAGSVYVNDSVAWTVHPSNADMLFQVIGIEETTEQIEKVVDFADQKLASYHVEVDTDVDNLLYMNNYQVARVYLETLMSLGTNGGDDDVVAFVDLDKNLFIQEKRESFVPSNIYRLAIDGSLKRSDGTPLDNGELIHGYYVEFDDTFASYGFSTDFFRTYIAECEWDESNRILKIMPESEDPYDKLQIVRNR